MMSKISQRGWLLLWIAAFTLFAAACAGSSDAHGSGEDGIANEALTESSASSITNENPVSYDPAVAQNEAYWYSRYNLGHLVMRSGMGIQWMPPMEKVQEMMKMAQISAGPSNPYLVEAIYSSGDPHLIQDFNGDGTDFSNFRWDQAKMDKVVTPQAVAYTMIKEVIWAKSFASDVEGANPMNHFRALVLSAEAAAQARFAMMNLQSSDGLLIAGWRDGQVTNTNATPLDQMVMLWALSELSDYAGGDYRWYGVPLTKEQALTWADELLVAVGEHLRTRPDFLTGMPSRDLGVALAALSSYVGYA